MKTISGKYSFEEKQLLEYMDDATVEVLAQNNAMIAGGAVRSVFTGTEINDIDVYCRSRIDMLNIVQYLKKNAHCASFSKKSTFFVKSGKININLVWFKAFDNLKKVFEAFDFTCVMGGYDVKSGKFIFQEDFFTDNMKKRLVYKPKNYYPFGSLLRIKKYESKGFKISKKEMLKIMVRCLQIPINTVEDLEDQLGTMYGLDCREIFKDMKELDYGVALEAIEKAVVPEGFHGGGYSGDLQRDIEEMFDEFTKYTKIGKRVMVEFGEDVDWMDEKHLPEGAKCREAAFPIYIYKNVRSENDENTIFSSYYSSQFKYKTGEVAIAYNEGVGLFCVAEGMAEGAPYFRNMKRATIKLRVDDKDDIINIDGSGNIQVKKAFVVGTVEVTKGATSCDFLTSLGLN